ncbi:histidinol-phosphate transaminase [Bacillus sp. HMF5848]|uniref:histidinol-phosphate transaminase n=1 Tax=Bacillus sp. HMF5848 TaxID=2495421 RepID=UPI000F76ABCF|nr:histidinol-phosphate transaminase [Bacillus sp. HMF5848]RSK27423.1 histidinol-phosphate transaminase [Bacillus sp. HMF5848]
MEVKKQLLNLTPYKPGKPIEDVKREYGLEKIVKLASNENPFGFSNKVKDVLQKQMDSINIYPDGYAAELRNAVAEHLKVSPRQLIFGNGSDEVVQILCRAYLSPSKNTVMAKPTFPQYKHNAVIEGADIREVTLIEGAHDLEGMLSAIDENTAIVWLCTPNNPTGVYISEEDLLSFLSRVPNNVVVVVDEAYFEYVVAEDYPDSISLLANHPNLVILRTFSKAYGLAGLRIGYGIASEQLLQSIEPAREPFNTSKLAQAAAIAALSDQAFVNESVLLNHEGLEQFYRFCDQHNLTYYQSQGNFILMFHNSFTGDEMFQYLLERGYIVRSGNALGFPHAIRVTVGTAEQNKQFFEILSSMLK